MISTPLERFRHGRLEVEQLVKLAPDPVDDRTGHNAVLRAAVVLLVSHFEGYLKLLCEAHIDWLSDGARESRTIPRSLREAYTVPLLEQVVQSGNTEQRWALLKKVRDLNCLWVDHAKPPAGLLEPSVLSRRVTSAKPNVIDEVFTLIGHASPVCEGDIDFTIAEEVQSLNIRRGLVDVVECRNDIAHGDVSRLPTLEDVDRYLAFLQALTDRLERKMARLQTA